MCATLVETPFTQRNCDTLHPSDTTFLNHLTPLEALRDSPAFRQAVCRAELIAARIQAQYDLTVENCRLAITAGRAFASALSNLAHCMNMDRLPKTTCSFSDVPSRWSGLNCDASSGLQQVNSYLVGFASYAAQLVNRLDEPERIIVDARRQHDRLFDLRANFHHSGEQLNSFMQRSANLNTSRSQTDVNSTDTHVAELRNMYRATASAYLTGLRNAIGSSPMLGYLHANGALVSAIQEFVEHLDKNIDEKNSSPISHFLLGSFLNRLTTWVETGQRSAWTWDQYTNQHTLEEYKPSRPPPQGVTLEGYLFKRAATRSWRTWARRWFRLRDNKLMYCKPVTNLSRSDLKSVTESALLEIRHQIHHNQTSGSTIVLANGNFRPGDQRTSVTANSATLTPTTLSNDLPINLSDRLLRQFEPQWKTMESDLRLCTARESCSTPDRRFTFELIAPGNRIHLLQADSYDQKERWMQALRSGLLHLQQPSGHTSYNDRSRNPDDLGGLPHGTPPLLPQSIVNLDSDQNRSNSARTTFAGVSQQSLPDYDLLRSQGGVILWREPDRAENRRCVDCAADEASWASINLGVTLCTQCAAAHRGLGVHVSKIRSLTLDNWEPELLHLMLNLGNNLVNRIYEANLPKDPTRIPRPDIHSSSDERQHWARAKWAQCQFVRHLLARFPDGTKTSAWVYELFDYWSELRKLAQAHYGQSDGQKQPQNSVAIRVTTDRCKRRYAILSDLCNTLDRMQEQTIAFDDRTKRRATFFRTAEQESAATKLLRTGAQLGCPPLMLAGLAAGAHPDGERNPSGNSSKDPSYTPLIWTVRSGSLAACQFLLLNGADIDAQDHLGRTALYHACKLQRVHIVCLLLRRRADPSRADHNGKLPLDVAVDVKNADIVTLLRLQRLQDEHKDSGNNLSDDIVTDVFRDYTSRAYFCESDTESDNTDFSDFTELRHSRSSPNISLTSPRSRQPDETHSTYSNNPTLQCVRVPRILSQVPTADARRRFASPTSTHNDAFRVQSPKSTNGVKYIQVRRLATNERT
ncbi:Arf-GAP with coiled-coil, ANK repeat and PH domain-containing protein 2 [Clonorchis sinensis]|uniref:Arf-GAP with coiled-coil, ANK repeat and PH domain-containing protein 2 n=1 Tax=Clonorchis sinensis TaxID=79923 RepID=A0A419Q2J8_CLOSI|nr:Arf-GAP with coiled-coil, ANK repeat and PH domain-containing protein 2 [Clonorchis sinensis]